MSPEKHMERIEILLKALRTAKTPEDQAKAWGQFVRYAPAELDWAKRTIRSVVDENTHLLARLRIAAPNPPQRPAELLLEEPNELEVTQGAIIDEHMASEISSAALLFEKLSKGEYQIVKPPRSK